MQILQSNGNCQDFYRKPERCGFSSCNLGECTSFCVYESKITCLIPLINIGCLDTSGHSMFFPLIKGNAEV